MRNRPRNGQPGLRGAHAAAARRRLRVHRRPRLAADRATRRTLPDAVPAPPTGEVTVVARLKPGEPALPGRSAADGQIATIQLAADRRRLDAPDLHRRLRAAASRRPGAGRAPAAPGRQARARRGPAPVVRVPVVRLRAARLRRPRLRRPRGVPAPQRRRPGRAGAGSRAGRRRAARPNRRRRRGRHPRRPPAGARGRAPAQAVSISSA